MCRTTQSDHGRKGDRLAAVPHLERWVERNHHQLYELPRRFEEAGLVHDRVASLKMMTHPGTSWLDARLCDLQRALDRALRSAGLTGEAAGETRPRSGGRVWWCPCRRGFGMGRGTTMA